MKTHTEYAYQTRVQHGIRIRNQFEFLIPVRYYVPIFAELQKSAHRKASMTFDSMFSLHRGQARHHRHRSTDDGDATRACCGGLVAQEP